MKLRAALLSSFLAAAPAAETGRTGEAPRPLPPVILNEVHYHPPRHADAAEEFVELHNRTGAPVDIEGWEIRGGIRFRFERAAGPTVIPPRGFLLVARSREGLSRLAGLPVSEIAGPFSGKLSNRKDRLVLLDQKGAEMEAMEYADGGPWPARADGLGSSLQRVSSEAPADLARNWRVGAGGARRLSPERVLFQEGSPVRWFENLEAKDPRFKGEIPWFHPAFDDRRNGWRDGGLAVGYLLNDQPFSRWIKTPATARRGLHSILFRIDFEAPAGSEKEAPSLLMDWDDGFIAWLDGVEIVRKFMRLPPGALPPWEGYFAQPSVPAGGDAEPAYRPVWRGAPGSLRAGRHLLAVANYNSSARSSDLYLNAKMVLGEPAADSADLTPGRANTVAAASPPPLVTLLERAPQEPTSRQPVVLRARVEGEGVEGVVLFYDLGSGETSLPMRDDGRGGDRFAGDGLYAAEVPAAPDQSLVRFRIEARDSKGGVALFPREGNPSSRAGYYVLDRPPRSGEELAVYHMLWSGGLRCGKGSWRRGFTFIHQGTAFLNVAFKHRGETSCGRPKSSLRVKFNRGELFGGQKKLNLLAGWEDRSLLREKLAWDLFRDIGHPGCRAELAAVYERGNVFHGLFVALEAPGARYLRRNGLPAGRGLWKCRNAFHGVAAGSHGGFQRLTARGDESEEAALEELLSRIDSLHGEDHLDFVLRHLDVEAFIEYQAVKCLISDEDGFSKNWLLYHGSRGGRRGDQVERWTAHPWDLDLSFGQTNLQDEGIQTGRHPLNGTIDHARHGSGWNGLIEAVFGRKSGDYFVKALYGRIWGLLDEKFNPRVLVEKIDRLDAETAEEARADLTRWPRWGSDPTSPEVHREKLRKFVQGRYRFLRGFLTSEHETSAEESAGPPAGLRGGSRRREPAGELRRFRYTPAPRMKITEILSRPGGDGELEFIEIRNLEKSPVDLAGWNIPAVGYLFPPGSEAPADSLFLVARNPERLRAAFPALGAAPVFGPYPGRLSGAGEDLRLRDSGLYQGKRYFPETIDAVKYRSLPPWPAVERGRSLELRDLSLDNDLPGSWRPSAARGGTPGR
jgi:hypothetical protein